jgi:hypothetical protein
LSKSQNVELGPPSIAFLTILTLALLSLCVFPVYGRPQMSDMEKYIFAGVTLFVSLFAFYSRGIKFADGSSSLNELVQAVGEFLASCMASFCSFWEVYITSRRRVQIHRMLREARRYITE